LNIKTLYHLEKQMADNKWKIKLLEPSFAPWQPEVEPNKQVAMLMSGGVDSSVTAFLLKKQGWQVLGITMKVPVFCNTKQKSYYIADAVSVCNQLNIPHYFIDVTGPFEKLIVNPFRHSYENGQTPNPCVDCNTFLKFSLIPDFLEHSFGIGHFATGHYARISKAGPKVQLGRAKDKTKDQSYFLYGITLKRLAELILPLGELTKQEVRSIAADLNLTISEKEESMELCFAGERDYRDLLTAAQANQQGDITDMHGNRIATHNGVANYTLGQRRGIGFAGGEPLYVSKIDARTNTIALGTREQVSYRTIKANQINTLIPEELVVNRQFFAKIRSYGAPHPCRLGRTSIRSFSGPEACAL